MSHFIIDTEGNTCRTDNDALQYKSSLSACVDLFFAIGNVRSYTPEIGALFNKALEENEVLALKILMWSRAVRLGGGRRNIFHAIIRNGLNSQSRDIYKQFIIKNARQLAIYGYWADLFHYFDIPEVVEVYGNALEHLDGLAGKWAPRKGMNAARLRNALRLTPKKYRKKIVALSQTVEQQMCAKQWGDIKYKSVPGVAMRRYSRAFKRHDEERFSEWLGDKSSRASVSSLYPHDIWYLALANQHDLAEKQWQSLPDYIEGGENILPMIDVSGSMEWHPYVKPTPLSIAVSLGIYVSQRIKGRFKNKYLSFSSEAALVTLPAGNSIIKAFDSVLRTDWGMNTDFYKAYQSILKAAKFWSIPQEEMPTMLLVLSDMQFDACQDNKLHIDMIKKLYHLEGYKIPKLVFWNLYEEPKGLPALNDEGISLVSGKNPILMKYILNAEKFNPLDIVKESVKDIEIWTPGKDRSHDPSHPPSHPYFL